MQRDFKRSMYPVGATRNQGEKGEKVCPNSVIHTGRKKGNVHTVSPNGKRCFLH